MSEKRKWKFEILEYFLRKLPQDELIGCIKTLISSICGDDDKALEDLTHTIVTYVHAREIIAGKSKLENYEEPHRTELKKMIESLR